MQPVRSESPPARSRPSIVRRHLAGLVLHGELFTGRRLLLAAGGVAAAVVGFAAADAPGGALLGASAAAVVGATAYALLRAHRFVPRARDLDPVTGLYNGERLARSWGELRSRAGNGHPLGVLMVTIDDAGAPPALTDSERRMVAEAVKRASGQTDSAFATGATRFVVLAPDVDAARIGVLTERLRACVRASLSPDLAVRARVRVCVSVVGRPAPASAASWATA